MRALLKKRVLYKWLPEHEKEFVKAKELLTSKHIVRFFDTKLPLSLLTDVSSLNGFGFALIQYDEDGRPRLLQAGSRTCTDTERHYAPIEQECLAAVWAMEKCRHYLFGAPTFDLVTDHKPLIGIFQKGLQDICLLYTSPSPRDRG